VKTSDKGLEFISLWEGTKLRIYKDVAGYATIGTGHLIVEDDPAEKWKRKGITTEEALELLTNDVKHAEDCVNRYISWRLIQNQFDSLVSWTFNLGGHALYRSTLRKVLNGSCEAKVPKEMARWNKAGGKVVPGLTKRRRAEGRLFNLAEYGTGP